MLNLLFILQLQGTKIKRPPKDEDGMNQPTLTENIMENFKQKAVNIEQRFYKYRDDPAALTGLFNFKGQTTKYFGLLIF